MAFTMHSHSGQFCPGHAADQLEDIVRQAISLGFRTMGLTEHMPRYEERDLYPDERDDPQASLAALVPRHEAYLVEARRLQHKYAPQIHILIGFEAEFIRPAFAPLVRGLARPPCVDYFVGSVHHVHGIPIDYDDASYAAAVAAAGGSEERLYQDYYDLQHDMLLALAPRVVGHFDLVRLKSAHPQRDIRRWKGVWDRVLRNLRLVKHQGGWLELNTAALRKGLPEPYPCRPVAEEWIGMGGAFTMSDDSHGIAQVGTNYSRGLSYLESLGVARLWTLERQPHPGVAGEAKATLSDKAVPVEVFRQHFKS
ncbi:histidinol-phosphatase [Metarhizium album ARSEF 1941]|uniref:Histidinol-phosphatase n=1 Tax=Metarhizium album (strain ARSEF 1941) TaxID=1081103 RepID=A0A0B2WUS6_METAS|nr:histidinol-phosphatase [Metarhizium album ARSEF 1941]KHN99801.1 histidinol-phosphatase [Metarhizium album ARSEF 1941]